MYPLLALSENSGNNTLLAFLSNSTNIENQRIIEDQMDALIAEKILENSPSINHIEYYDVIKLIEKFSENPKL